MNKEFEKIIERIDKDIPVYTEKAKQIVKEVADEYKDKIPQKLYEAMYNWKVEITD